MARPEITIQPKDKRVENFTEVDCGFTKKQAVEESSHCPQCAHPTCEESCPLGINITAFIRKIREGDFNGSIDEIRERNPLAGICGRLCLAPCEKACVLKVEVSGPIKIRALERFASDIVPKKPKLKTSNKKNQKRIAVVGSGPSGLTVAADLAQKGYSVTIFESLHLAGGVLKYGIPEFRSPQEILERELRYVQSLGVEIRANVFIGQTVTIEELFKEGYAGVCLATGAGIPKLLGIPGENLIGVYPAGEYLMSLNLMKGYLPKNDTSIGIGRKIAVIGNGSTALDCARISIRLDREVTLVHQGTEDDIKVRPDIKEHAKEEGVKLEVLTKPIEILSDENYCVKGIKCIRMDFADPDRSGKWKVIPVKGSEFTLDADTVILAAGHKSNSLLANIMKDLKVNRDGTIWTGKGSSKTSLEGVFAGGDVAIGPSSIVHSMAKAKEAASKIDQYLCKEKKQK